MFIGFCGKRLLIINIKELLLNNMVKFTSFVKYNNKLEQNHDNYAFERINNENNYEIYKF